MTAFCDRMPLPGETVFGNDFVTGPGGKGANQAVAAKRLGGNVSFICKVGNDIFGTFLTTQVNGNIVGAIEC